MTHLIASRLMYWSAQDEGGNIYVADVCPAGGKIGIPPKFTPLWDEDGKLFLEKCASSKISTVKPLPVDNADVGIYTYEAKLVICKTACKTPVDPSKGSNFITAASAVVAGKEAAVK